MTNPAACLGGKIHSDIFAAAPSTPSRRLADHDYGGVDPMLLPAIFGLSVGRFALRCLRNLCAATTIRVAPCSRNVWVPPENLHSSREPEAAPGDADELGKHALDGVRLRASADSHKTAKLFRFNRA